MREFWERIAAALDAIEGEKPGTFDAVRDILHGEGNPEGSSAAPTRDSAFFAGSGGDRSLLSALIAAGWRQVWAEASYFYVARHSATGELLTYVEGDVLRGDAR